MDIISAAISHFEYGISHDIFKEPVTSYARAAVDALRAQRSKRELLGRPGGVYMNNEGIYVPPISQPPCVGCDSGWGSISNLGYKSCHDSCDYIDRHGVARMYCIKNNHVPNVEPEHYCSYGERKEGADNG